MKHLPRIVSRQAGFTLAEIIVTIVIMGIVGGMVAVFLKLPVQSYQDAVARSELSDVADTAVRRLTREARLAVPNSIRVNSTRTVLEFVPTKTGGRYLAAADGQPLSSPILDFDTVANRSFTVVGTMPTGSQAITAGDSIVVYNIGEGQADVYALAGNRATVDTVVGQLVSMASNPFAAQVPEMAHPSHRFLVATAPVTYRCAPPLLLRHSNYGFNPVQIESPGGTQAILARNVQSCSFDHVTLANATSAMLTITLVFRPTTNADADVTLSQQIHVNNAP